MSALLLLESLLKVLHSDAQKCFFLLQILLLEEIGYAQFHACFCSDVHVKTISHSNMAKDGYFDTVSFTINYLYALNLNFFKLLFRT